MIFKIISNFLGVNFFLTHTVVPLNSWAVFEGKILKIPVVASDYKFTGIFNVNRQGSTLMKSTSRTPGFYIVS